MRKFSNVETETQKGKTNQLPELLRIMTDVPKNTFNVPNLWSTKPAVFHTGASDAPDIVFFFLLSLFQHFLVYFSFTISIFLNSGTRIRQFTDLLLPRISFLENVAHIMGTG